MTFQDTVNQYFPNTITEEEFVQQTYEALSHYGFHDMNTIACGGVCRDELSRSLLNLVEKRWGQVFNMSSLAGMLFLGKTGFLAAMHHSPIVDGRERYVYIVMPHIAIGEDGAIGVCYRPGRAAVSSACGALSAFQKELEDSQLSLETDPYDIEQSLLKQRLLRKINYGDVPDLVTLTKLAHEVILEDLEKMLELTLNPDKSDYAVLTGVQLHGRDNVNYVWPSVLYAVVNQQKHEIRL